MKKGISKALVLILAAGILLLPACGKTETSGNNEQNVQNVDERGSDASNNPPGGFMGGNPDLYGEVKAINGNKLTISVLEMVQRKQMTDEERQKMKDRKTEGSGSANNAPNPSNAPNPGNAPNASNAPNSGNDREPGGSGRPGGGFTGGEKKYTGETVELEVASDTPITSFGMGNRGKNANGGSDTNSGNENAGNKRPGNIEEKQLSLSDIKVGSVIQVWYSGDNGDKKEIKNIRVMQSSGGPKSQQNTTSSQ